MSARSRTSAMSSSRISPATAAVYVRTCDPPPDPSTELAVPRVRRGVGEARDLVHENPEPVGVALRGGEVGLERWLEDRGCPSPERLDQLADHRPLVLEDPDPV